MILYLTLGFLNCFDPVLTPLNQDGMSWVGVLLIKLLQLLDETNDKAGIHSILDSENNLYTGTRINGLG